MRVRLAFDKFKDSLTQEQVDEVIKTFNALPSKIPGILGYEAGTNVSKEGKSEGLTHSFVLTFKNMEDLDAYIAHPAHQAKAYLPTVCGNTFSALVC